MGAQGRIGLLVMAALAIFTTGCQSSLADERDKLVAQNREMQSTIDRLKMEKSAAPAGTDTSQADGLRDQLAARDAELAAMKAAATNTPGPGPSSAGGDFGGAVATIDPKAGTLTVNIPGDVLFASGQATIKPTSHATLDKIAATLKKDYGSKQVLINGFTDSDKINKTKDKFDDNWDLSYERAKAVMQYLESKQVASKNLAIVANGENHAKASKDLSRRVEIVVNLR